MSLYDDYRKVKDANTKKSVAGPVVGTSGTGGLYETYAAKKKENAAAPVVSEDVSKAVLGALQEVKAPTGRVTFDASRSAFEIQAERLRSIPTEIGAPKPGATYTPDTTFGEKVSDIARKVLPTKLKDLFGLSPRSDTAKRIETWGSLSLNMQRMHELDKTVREVVKEKFPDGKVTLPDDYQEPTGFLGQFKEGVVHAYIGTLKPVIGTMLEQAQLSPESVAWGKKQGDRAVAQLITRPDLEAPEDLPEFFKGGAGDRRWWGRAIGSAIPSIAAALGSSVAAALVTRSPAAGVAAAWTTTFGLESTNAYRDLLNKGLAPDKAKAASNIYGAIAAQLEMSMGVNPGALGSRIVTGSPISRTLADSFLKYTNSTLIKAPAKVLWLALEEGNEEAAQQFTQNLITGYLYSGQGLSEGVAESWAQGFAGGLPFGASDAVVTTSGGEPHGGEPPERPKLEAEIKKEAADALARDHSASDVEEKIKEEFGVPASQAQRIVEDAAEEAGIELPSFMDQEDEVAAGIKAATEAVTGKKEKEPELEGVPDDVQEILNELQEDEDVQRDWNENYAEEFHKLNNRVIEIQKELDTAKKKDKAALQKQTKRLEEKMAEIQDEFLEKYTKRAEEIAAERGRKEEVKKAVDAVEQSLEAKPITEPGETATAEQIMEEDDTIVPLEQAVEARRKEPVPVDLTKKQLKSADALRAVLDELTAKRNEDVAGLTKLHEKGSDALSEYDKTIANDSAAGALQTALQLKQAHVSYANSQIDYVQGLIDKMESGQQTETHVQDTRGGVRQEGVPEGGRDGGAGPGERAAEDREPGADVARGQRGERGDRAGKRPSARKRVEGDGTPPVRVENTTHPTGETGVPVKETLADTYHTYYKAVFAALGDEWEVDEDYATKGGDISRKAMYNPGGDAVEGDSNVIFWKKGSDYGVYLHGSGRFVNGFRDGDVNFDPNALTTGIELSWSDGNMPALMYRATTKAKKYTGFMNQYADPTKTTPTKLAQLLEREVFNYMRTEEMQPEEVAANAEEEAAEKRDLSDVTMEEIEAFVKDRTTIDKNGEVIITKGDTQAYEILSDEELEMLSMWTPAGGREKKGAEGRGLLDEFYTPELVVEMVDTELNKWVPGGTTKWLEPSAGTGNFFDAMPITGEHVAYEINPIAAGILKLKHPRNTRVFNKPFEDIFMSDRGVARKFEPSYDLVAGNPPYGEHRGKYKGLGEEPKISRYEEYFLKRALDLLKDDRYTVMVIPSGFLRGGPSPVKEMIAKRGTLVSAWRLPNGAFDTTDIGTDIVVFKKQPDTSPAVVGARMQTLVNDQYMDAHQQRILGEQGMRKGKFGMEPYVRGTLEEAAAMFDDVNENEIEEDIAVAQDMVEAKMGKKIELADLGREELEVEAGGITKDLSESRKPAEYTRVRKISKQKTGTKKSEKAVKPKKGEIVKKTGKVLKMEKYSTASKEEAALWKYTTATGELRGDFNKEHAYLYKGQYYNRFNYQTGNIYEKLDQLEAEKDQLSEASYKRQKEALEEVKPEPLPLSRLALTPQARIVHEFKYKGDAFEVPISIAEQFDEWMRSLPRAAFGESNLFAIRGYVNNDAVRGDNKIENERTRRTRRIEGDRLFKLFVTENMPEAEQKRFEEQYNRQFNAYARPDYRNVPLMSTLHATFKRKELNIKDVQLQGVGFLVNKGAGLLAHDVGVGKTMQGIIAIAEVLERGWAKRPLVVVPSPLVYKEWIKEIVEIIPDVKINALSNLGGDFKGDLKTLEIPEGSISIVTEEGFKKLGFTNETYADLTSDFMDAIENPNDMGTARAREKEKAKAEENVAKGIKGTLADRTFEDLGFDHITVDEVHNANHIIQKAKVDEKDKKKVSEFRAFQVTPSQFGIKVWLATQYILKQNGGRNVQLLSATPFTNNPLEYYSTLSLMARDRMREMGILNVNDFMTMFMEIETELEVRADGSVKEKAEVRKIKNYQLFRKLLTEFIDFRDGVEAGVVRPERVSKEYIVGESREATEYKALAQELFNDKKHAGPLKAITELRAIAFSPFLSQFHTGEVPTPSLLLEKSPKLRVMVDLIKQTLSDNEDAAQLIYSPVGVEYFPLLRDAIIEKTGLSPDEVQIISGATTKPKRQVIQEQFNAGKVKVVIGSDSIKEGVNLQERTTDLHILSLPWNFTDLRQVIGRAWRQGNQWTKVRVNNYFTENSVDVFLSQKLQNKERRYEATLEFKGDTLDIGDIDFEEMKNDLITDPEMRVEVEFHTKGKLLEREINRLMSEEAYKNRRAEEYLNDIERLQQAEHSLQVYPDNDFYKDLLERRKKELAETKERMRVRGIDVETIAADVQGTLDKIKELRKQQESMEKDKAAAMEAAKTQKLERLLAPVEYDYDAHVRERAEENEDFFEIRAKKRGASLTTRILQKLTGHATVSKQFISDLTNSPDLKQPERDLIRWVLEGEGAKVDVKDFTQRVEAQLLELTTGDNPAAYETAKKAREAIFERQEKSGLPVAEYYKENPADAQELDRLNKKISEARSDAFVGPKYESVTLPEDIRGPVADYREKIYQSPIETNAGGIHFERNDYPGYFAHTRVEDLPNKGMEHFVAHGRGNVTGGLPPSVTGKGGTRRIIEVQSDLFQKGNLDKQGFMHRTDPTFYDEEYASDMFISFAAKELGISLEEARERYIAGDIDMDPEDSLGAKFIAQDPGGLAASAKKQMEPYRNTWWQRIIREEVRSAAQDGKIKLQFPVGETAMKIEGLGDRISFLVRNDKGRFAHHDEATNPLKVGGEVEQYGVAEGANRWIITDVLGDGKFKANRATEGRPLVDGKIYLGDVALGYNKVVGDKVYIGSRTETFDISGNIDTENPIYKFYEKDVAKFLKGQYDAKRITDPQGVEWMEVDITPDMASDPVLAYKRSLPDVQAWEEERDRILTAEENDALLTYREALVSGVEVTPEVKDLAMSAFEKYKEFTSSLKKLRRQAESNRVPFDMSEEAGKRLFESLFNKDEVQFLFKRENLLDNGTEGAWGYYRPARGWSNAMVRVVTAGGEVQSKTIYHEAFHAYMDRFVPEQQRQEVLERVRTSPVLKLSLATYRGAYKKEEVAEEWLADDFAAYASGKDHMNENVSFYQSILNRIREWIRKLTGAQEIYDNLLARVREAPRRVPIISSEVQDTPSELDEEGDVEVRAKLRSIGWGAAIWEGIMGERKEAMENIAKADVKDLNRDLLRKDINTLENLTAQARDIYLKDKEEFSAANDFQRVADARRMKKAALDKYFSNILQPYYKLKGGERERVNKALMAGDLEARELKDADLTRMGLSESDKVSYRAVRKAFNIAHQYLIEQMRKNGVPEDEIKDFERERAGYMPHKWKYRFAVKHQVNKKDGSGWYTYQMDNFKSERLAREAWENLKKANTRDDVRYTLDTLDSLQVDFFSEQKLSYQAIRSVMAQAKTPADVRKTMLEALRNMVKEKGFGRNYMKRTGTRGYETKEVGKIIADYFSGMNGYITKMEAGQQYYKILSTIDARRQSRFYEWTRDMIAYDMGNTKEWHWARTIAYMYYLANDISFLAVNATQNFIVGTGELSKYMTGAQKVIGPEKYITTAMVDWQRGHVSADEKEAVEGLVNTGELGGEMVSELMGFKNNPLYTEISSGMSKALYHATAYVEQNVNRVPAFIAARRLFIEQGMDEKKATQKALEVANDIHFRYGKQNRPRFERGRIGVLFVFYHYMRSFLYQLSRDLTQREYAAFARKMLYTTVLGGTISLPFAQTLVHIFREIFGSSCDLGNNADCEMAAEMPKWLLAVERGLPSLTGVDLAGRVGIGLISVDSIISDPNDIRSYLGAVGNILWVNPKSADEGGRIQQGIELMRQGRIADSLGKLLPDVAANPIKAYAGYTWGVRSFAGTPLQDVNGDLFKYNTWEAIIKATGFSPTRENLAWDAKSKQWVSDDKAQAERTRLRRSILGMVQRGEIAEARAAQDEAKAAGTLSEQTNYLREFGKDTFIKDALNEWNNGQKTASSLRAIENDLISTMYGGEATDIQELNVRKEFAVYRTFGLKDELVEDLMSAQSNSKRVERLLRAREEMGEAAFLEFVQKARKSVKTAAGNESHILISDDLLEDYKKARAKAQK